MFTVHDINFWQRFFRTLCLSYSSFCGLLSYCALISFYNGSYNDIHDCCVYCAWCKLFYNGIFNGCVCFAAIFVDCYVYCPWYKLFDNVFLTVVFIVRDINFWQRFFQPLCLLYSSFVDCCLYCACYLFLQRFSQHYLRLLCLLCVI